MKKVTISSSVTTRETQSFKQYLRNISEIKILTTTEERILTEKISRGDKTAIDELIHRNLRFVISVAKQYANNTIPLEDLVNEGNIGLIIAANKYDHTTGFKFISYAVWWIQKLILEHLAKHGKTVRIPSNKINGVAQLEKKISELEQKYARNVDINEVIAEFGDSTLNGDRYENLIKLSSFNVSSLDKVIGHNDDSNSSTTLADMLSDESDNSSDYLIVGTDIKAEITRILEVLKPRDKQIMIALYGLDGKAPRTLKEVGAELSPTLTREMIRQIRNRCLDFLKQKLGNSTLKDCL